MRQLIILTFSIVASITSYGQSQKNTSAGAYATLADFQSNKPTYTDTFLIAKRTTADIKAWGGNDYKIESTSPAIAKKTLKSQMWGVFANDTLYLNGMQLTGLPWYAKVEVLGKFCLLKPSFPPAPKIQKELGLHDPQYGYLFGAVGGAIQGGKMAVKRIPLIYSLTNGQKMVFSKNNILQLLENQNDLKTDFLAEAEQGDEETLIKYLKLLNER